LETREKETYDNARQSTISRHHGSDQARNQYKQSIVEEWTKRRQSECAQIVAQMLLNDGICKVVVDRDGKVKWFAFAEESPTEDEE
jgi:hypothetical protein